MDKGGLFLNNKPPFFFEVTIVCNHLEKKINFFRHITLVC